MGLGRQEFAGVAFGGKSFVEFTLRGFVVTGGDDLEGFRNGDFLVVRLFGGFVERFGDVLSDLLESGEQGVGTDGERLGVENLRELFGVGARHRGERVERDQERSRLVLVDVEDRRVLATELPPTRKPCLGFAELAQQRDCIDVRDSRP